MQVILWCHRRRERQLQCWDNRVIKVLRSSAEATPSFYKSGKLFWISHPLLLQSESSPVIFFRALEGCNSGKPQALSRLHPAPSKYAGIYKQLHVSTDNGNAWISAKQVKFNRSLTVPCSHSLSLSSLFKLLKWHKNLVQMNQGMLQK